VILRKNRLQLDILGEEAFKQFLYRFYRFVHIERDGAHGFLSAEGEEALGKIRRFSGGKEDLVDILLQGTVLFHPCLHEGGVPHEARDNIVEIVGNPSCQCADSLHLLGLTELGFEVLQFSNVAQTFYGTDHIAFPVKKR